MNTNNRRGKGKSCHSIMGSSRNQTAGQWISIPLRIYCDNAGLNWKDQSSTSAAHRGAAVEGQHVRMSGERRKLYIGEGNSLRRLLAGFLSNTESARPPKHSGFTTSFQLLRHICWVLSMSFVPLQHHGVRFVGRCLTWQWQLGSKQRNFLLELPHVQSLVFLSTQLN